MPRAEVLGVPPSRSLVRGVRSVERLFRASKQKSALHGEPSPFGPSASSLRAKAVRLAEE
jgi:hypothetical protein